MRMQHLLIAAGVVALAACGETNTASNEDERLAGESADVAELGDDSVYSNQSGANPAQPGLDDEDDLVEPTPTPQDPTLNNDATTQQTTPP